MGDLVIWDEKTSQIKVKLSDQHYAMVKVILVDDTLTITSTSVPESLRGKGSGSQMMETLLVDIEQKGLKVIPVCSYVDYYLTKNPQWAHLKA